MNQPTKMHNDVQAMGAASTYTSFVTKDSSSRLAMVTSQLAQAIQVAGAEPSRCLHGFETQMSEYVFGTKAPCDLTIVDVIPKYSAQYGEYAIKTNPLTTIIYQDEFGNFDTMDIEMYHKNHDTFGFKSQINPAYQHLQRGDFIEKGTMLSYSNNIKNGYYSPGVMANVCYLGVPGVIEDGFVVSESFNERCKSKGVSSRVIEFGGDWVPLNLYGTPENPKIHPDVGDRVPDHGIVFGRRKKGSAVDAIALTPEALMEPDLVFDDLIFGKPGALIYDVDVLNCTNSKTRYRTVPDELAGQALRYNDLQKAYFDKLLDIRKSIQMSGNDSKIQPKLLSLFARAYAYEPNAENRAKLNHASKSIKRTYRAAELNEFRVEVKYEYDFDLMESAKLSDLHGGKGVECVILPDDQMPTDDFGNVADVCVYGRSAIARLNPGQLYEQYINAASRDITLDVKAMMDKGDMDGAAIHLLKYYEIASPPMADLFRKLKGNKRNAHLETVYRDGIYLHIPADNDWTTIDLYRKMEEFRPVNISPVTYTNSAGNRVRTKSEVLIGGKYMIVLEKSESKSMACTGPRLQHHGLPASSSRATRYSTPTKEQAPRVYGESEGRALSGSIGSTATAHLIGLTTNPAVHREVVKNILMAENPSDIPMVVDREKFPLGNERACAFVNHLLNSQGVGIENV